MSLPDKSFFWKPWHTWAFLAFTVLLSFFTYFYRYTYPPYVYWDENYHIASAQKYLHGVYFMEQHPPLGKLLIAAGEKILHPNARNDQFLGTDYATDFGDSFSFAGYRLFPALLAWLTAPVLFATFYLLSRRNPLHATLLSFLYVFDNALIVHLRGAMLEGPFLFFSSLTLLAFLLLWNEESKKKFIWWSVLFGTMLGAVLTTKVLGLVLILLVPALAWGLLKSWRDTWKFAGMGAGCLVILALLQWIPSPGLMMILSVLAITAFIIGFWYAVPHSRAVTVFLAVMFPCFLLVYGGVWYTHFALGKTINDSLPDAGYYQASDEYKGYLTAGTTAHLASFPLMLRENLKFVTHYNNGAPRLDLCKMDENGSPWFLWPVGARSINYRWATPGLQAGKTAADQTYSYLYLQVNPMVWWIALAGLVMGAGMVLGSAFFPLRRPVGNLPLLCMLLGIYVCFFIAVSQIGRVLYLYHYFLPLILSFLILAIVIDNIQGFWKWTMNEQGRTLTLMILAMLMFAGFQFYRPLTYYEPMTDVQVERRAILKLWELHCVNCDKSSVLVVPTK